MSDETLNHTPQDHYERLLARHYTWMFGTPFKRKAEEQAALLREAGIVEPGMAVDLGCGSGFQAVALADLGATRVHAFDTSAALLAELEGHAEGRAITTYEADLTAFGARLDGSADTIVCMGDTVTHLGSTADVVGLFGTIGEKLEPGGRLVLSWRDLSNPPEGLDRFIPVRSTDDRIMTCFLEDRGETVLVHDLIHERGPDGWQLRKSTYPKLKLSPGWVRERLEAAGLLPDFEQTVRGMTVMAATK